MTASPVSSQDSRGRARDSSRRSALHTVAVVVAAFVVVVLIAALVFIDPILDGYVRNRLTDAVNSGAPGRELSVGRLQYDLFGNSFIGEDIEYTTVDTSAAGVQRTVVRAGRGVVSDVNWWALLTSNGLRLGEIRIEQPEWRSTLDPQIRSETAEDGSGEQAAAIADRIAAALPDRFLPLHVGRVAVERGTVVQRTPAGRDSVADVEIVLRDVAVGGTARRDTGRLWSLAEIAAGHVEYMLGAEYIVRADSVRYHSLNEPLLTVSSASLQPAVSAEQFWNRQRYRSELFDIRIPRLLLRNMRLHEFLQHGAVVVSAVEMNDATVGITLNKRLPVNPSAPPPKMPHELVNSLQTMVRIDSTVLRNTKIVYRELFPYSDKPAVLEFTSVDVGLSPIVLEPGGQSGRAPVRLTGTGRLAGAGRLDMSLYLPLDVDTLAFRCEGSLGPMNPEALNDFLSVADRIRITSGSVDRAGFSLDVQGGTATGTVRAVYTGLNITVLDEETGSAEGLMPRLKTLMANVFKIRQDNPPDDAKQGTVAYRRKPDDAFLDVLWLSVRQGLSKIVGF